jgi:uncharacterized membrane protein YkoI
MKQTFKVLVGAFAAIGVITTVTSLSSVALAQGGKTLAFSQEKGEKGEKGEKQAAKPGPMTAPHAKITPIQAMKLATEKAGGKATMTIFEFDEGHWVYGVVVVKNHKLMEVEIDPMSGKVLASEAVTPDDEAKEMKSELENMMK